MEKTKVFVMALFIIIALLSIIFEIAFLVTRVLNLPLSLDLPIELRIVGAVSIGVGVVLVLWLFKYRRPATMLVSTYFTFRKLFTRAPIGEASGRIEPLIIRGPQKYVRHPLYLGAIIVFWGYGLLTGTTSILIGALIVLFWFRLVQIPFEEKEMRALFGDQYVRYMHDTPMLIPFMKLRAGKIRR